MHTLPGAAGAFAHSAFIFGRPAVTPKERAEAHAREQAYLARVMAETAAYFDGEEA